jgi:hypothetical protein
MTPFSMTINFIMMTMTMVTTLIATIKITIIQINMMMAKLATSEPMSRRIGIRRTIPGVSIRTIRVSLSWRVI